MVSAFKRWREFRTIERYSTLMQGTGNSFGLLFDHHPEPMWIYERQTLRFLAVNDAAIEHYGYSRDEFLAMDISQFLPSEEAARLSDQLARPRPHLKHSGIWRHLRRDGSVIHVEITSH